MEDSPGLEEQLIQWKDEQLRVASQVLVVLDDEEHNGHGNGNGEGDNETNAQGDDLNPRFKQLPLLFFLEQEECCCYYYGGVDVSFPIDDGDDSVATYVIVDGRQNGKIVYRNHVFFSLSNIPYVSSFLSFREIQPLVNLVSTQLRDAPHITPKVILVDGNGIFHERRAGIACFLGVYTNLPTIGVGKTLYATDGLQPQVVKAGIDATLVALQKQMTTDALREKLFATNKGRRVVLVDKVCLDPNTVNSLDDEVSSSSRVDREEILTSIADVCNGIGIKLKGASSDVVLACALLGHGNSSGAGNKRKKSGTKNPIYISVGHKISLEIAVAICAELALVARIPEPIRQADLWGRELLRIKEQQSVVKHKTMVEE